MKLRLGRVDYLNCLPVYYAFAKKLVSAGCPLRIIKGVPTALNQMFFEGKLDVTPLSSIEYARHSRECLILPNISISADGRVGSILLFSRIPVTELEGCRIALTSSSSTSADLLHILFEHYYHVNAAFSVQQPDLDTMLRGAEAALLIGDDALIAHHRVLDEGLPIRVTDLGEVWKDFTGEKMVYALWVVRKEFADRFPGETNALSEAITAAKVEGMDHLSEIIRSARRRTRLPGSVLEEYFDLIRHDFDTGYQRALLLYYDYAYKSGLIEDRVQSLSIYPEKLYGD
ncbi:MAG: menaquinone biosynthesis protein [Bacillota bacterium]